MMGSKYFHDTTCQKMRLGEPSAGGGGMREGSSRHTICVCIQRFWRVVSSAVPLLSPKKFTWGATTT